MLRRNRTKRMATLTWRTTRKCTLSELAVVYLFLFCFAVSFHGSTKSSQMHYGVVQLQYHYHCYLFFIGWLDGAAEREFCWHGACIAKTEFFVGFFFLSIMRRWFFLLVFCFLFCLFLFFFVFDSLFACFVKGLHSCWVVVSFCFCMEELFSFCGTSVPILG